MLSVSRDKVSLYMLGLCKNKVCIKYVKKIFNLSKKKQTTKPHTNFPIWELLHLWVFMPFHCNPFKAVQAVHSKNLLTGLTNQQKNKSYFVTPRHFKFERWVGGGMI